MVVFESQNPYLWISWFSLQDYSSTLSIGEGEAIALALADAVINGALDDGEVGDNFTQQNQWLSNADSVDLLYLVQNVYVSLLIILR